MYGLLCLAFLIIVLLCLVVIDRIIELARGFTDKIKVASEFVRQLRYRSNMREFMLGMMVMAVQCLVWILLLSGGTLLVLFITAKVFFLSLGFWKIGIDVQVI